MSSRQLPDGVAWKERADQLTAAEARHADLLGEHYYRRAEADFAKIHQAIQVARRALDLAAGQRVTQEFTGQLARGAATDPAIPYLARGVDTSARSWLGAAGQVLGVDARVLSTIPITGLRAWCTEAASRLHVLHDAVHRLSALAGAPMSIDVTRSALEQAKAASDRRAEIAATMAEDRDLLGDLYQGVGTDWAAMRDALGWAGDVRAALRGPVRPTIAEALMRCAATSAELDEHHTAWVKASGRAVGQFAGPRAADIEAELTEHFDDAQLLLESLRESVGDIETWASYSDARAELEQHGLEPVVTFCRESRVVASDVRAAVERAVLEAWADAVFTADRSRLGRLRPVERDALVDEFRRLDLEQVSLAAARVVNACAARRPTSNVGQAGTIQRESAKQRRHMPIRKLLGQAGEVAQRLKPCFMMSPLTVSQFLPPTLRFDVVIFDEASQVRPSDAVNCVYRGGQLIVAGDDQQLPPTNFFGSGSADDGDVYDEDQVDDFESVLDQCKTALESLPLAWHYRSQHEDLITYSNYRFYKGQLATFPGATQDADDLGVKLFKIDGVYRRGAARPDNPREAAKVIERVLYHRRHHPHLTLGVVAFSGAQEDAIENELERQALTHPELAGLHSDDRLDGFFIKNLENVQGDERDIIIFSIGYGPDEHGKFTMQVPHLVRPKSERRLNVAITRAKRRVEIVTSVLAEDFRGSAGGAMRHLPRYLDFAARGITALALDPEESKDEVESPFEDEVVRAVRSWGHTAVPQVGMAGYRIDIGVKHPDKPGRFVLGIECDGAMYHSSKVARDRDRLRQQVLEGLGWTIHRIWGPSWYRNRAEQEQRLRQAIEDAVTGVKPVSRPDTGPEEVIIKQHVVDLDESRPWTQPYRLAQLRSVNVYYELHEPEARPELRRLVEQTVLVEGPVHVDRVLRAVRTAWDLRRSGSRITAAFDAAVRDLRGTVDRDGAGFLRMRSSTSTPVRVPTDDPDTERPVKHVPLDELALAAVHLVRDCHTVDHDELSRRVAVIFGWARRGPDVAAALDDAIDLLARQGQVVVADGQVRARDDHIRP